MTAEDISHGTYSAYNFSPKETSKKYLRCVYVQPYTMYYGVPSRFKLLYMCAHNIHIVIVLHIL